MPDLSVVQTVISTIGALFGALGGVTLTNRTSARREETQFQRAEIQAHRQRQDQQRQERQRAHQDLLAAANELRVEVEFAGQRHWNDMNVRLDAIRQHAVSASQHASRVALLSPGTARVARELASAASGLAATTARLTQMGGDQNQPLLSGQITQPIDLTDFDECIERFSEAMAQDSHD